MMVEKVLEMDGHTIATAQNGIEALERLASELDIGAVVCDLMMPDIDGDEVYRRYVKASKLAGTQPDIPFILLTSAQDIGRLKDAKAVGFLDIMSKPPNYERLKETIKAIEEGRSDQIQRHRLDTYIHTIKDLARSLSKANDHAGARYLLDGLEEARRALLEVAS